MPDEINIRRFEATIFLAIQRLETKKETTVTELVNIWSSSQRWSLACLLGFYPFPFNERIDARIIVVLMPNKMKLTILASSIVILQVFLGFTSANVWLINRTLTREPWLNRDSFSIPSSLCHQNNGNDACYPFGALSDKHKNCSCYCPFQNSSFVYHENKWTCLQNGKVRKLQGKRTRQFRLAVCFIYTWWNVKNMLWFILFKAIVIP